ncbi:MAG: glutamyl-tRNA reductase [Salinigranum sp.]
MKSAGVISGLSVSHRNASVDEIECVSRADERTVVSELLSREGVTEAFALETCNRMEAYVVTGDVERGRGALSEVLPPVRDEAVVRMDHEASLRHLMRVATGLESLVLGEDQILGQFKSAIEEAEAAGGVGPLLEEALTKAIHVGERARTETAINEGIVSLGRAAVELARERIELADASALVVGAGEMGQITARALADANVRRLVVANRTRSRAERLARGIDVESEAVGLDDLRGAIDGADVVVAATGSPDYVLDASALDSAGETLVVDIAQPRDVDPTAAALAGVEVFDIDALEAVTDRTRANRRDAAEAVEVMIDEEFERLLESFKRKRADEAISAMYESAERVKTRELEKALTKLDAEGGLTDAQRETVGALADALVGQLLAAPTRSLRDAAARDDWTTIQTAMRLFDPDFDGDTAPGAAGTSDSEAHSASDDGGPPASNSPGGPRGTSDGLAGEADLARQILEQLSND